MASLRDSIEILSCHDGEQMTRSRLTLLHKANIPDLSVFNIERIQNTRMKKLSQ